MDKDYAYPTMKAEKCLLELHRAVLSKDFEKAEAECRQAIQWLVDLAVALEVMKR